MSRDIDELFMRQALALARKGYGRTSPNPMVGALLVKRGKVIRKSRLGEITAKGVFDAARKGDRLALELVNEVCVYLGMGVATSMNAFAPDGIVIGGSVCKAGIVLLRPLREQADRFLMPVHRPHLKVLPAKLGGKSGIMGAAALAMGLKA